MTHRATTSIAETLPEPAAGQHQRRFSILLVCRSYPPVIGGSEVEAQRVCSGLIRRGHRVEVVCCGGDPMPAEKHWTDPYGVPVRMYGSGSGRINDWAYAAGVVYTLLRERRNFELIYFLMPGAHVAVGIPFARLLGLPTVMKFAGSSEIRHTLAAAIGPLEIAAIRKWCERIMILNDGMTEEALSVGFDRNRLLWMPNPVDTESYRPVSAGEKTRLRGELGLPADSRIAIFVGRLAPEKELPSLFAGFAEAAAKDERARLVVAGDGPMRPALTQQAAELGVAGRVHFAGFQNSEQVARWLQASDVFTLVSSREGLPVSLIEAMAVGLPSVVSDLPATAQLVENGNHGFRVPVGDSQAIGSVLVRLLSDDSLRHQLGIAGRSVAERFSTDKVLSAYERVFEELLPVR